MLHPDEIRELNERLARAERRSQRERTARQEAESLLEKKSLELFQSNELLRRHSSELEQMVEARTADLAEALARAEAATRAKSEFLATVSHEIRTPLNGILGLADVLSLTPLNDEQKRHLDLLTKSGVSLLALINDLLDFSKIEAGQLRIELRDFNPRAELEPMVETHLPMAHEKGLVLVSDFRDLPVLVSGDSHRIRQVFANLLGNAIKFTEKGRVLAEISATSTKSGWSLNLRVTDTGIGISPEMLPRLFEPFSQGDSSITRRFGGTGLGLAISRRLAEAMGGSLELVPGPLTCFEARIPVQQPALDQTPFPSPEPSQIPSLSILVVDDHEVNLTVALTLLTKLGQRTSFASGGRRAVELVASQAFDLVFMDMQMPDMDGLSATEQIRKLPLEKQPRIVAVTANAFPADRARCLAAGMDSFLSKPFRMSDLIREIQAFRG